MLFLVHFYVRMNISKEFEGKIMNNRKNLIDWFVKGIFFNKNLANDYNGEVFHMSSTNENDVLLAVKKAYIDMTPRTIEGLGDAHKIDGFDDKLDKILFELTKSFVDYFKTVPFKEETDFDDWHEKVCSKFEKDFNKLLEDETIKDKNGNITKISYGKAQKIVNMTFKYIYCFDDKKDHDYFKHCHMTLDSYTLNWFLNDVRNWFMKNNNFKFAKNKIPLWSNLSKGGFDEKFSYLWIQTQIRKYLKEQNKLPFFAEFIIWQEEKAKAVKKK